MRLIGFRPKECGDDSKTPKFNRHEDSDDPPEGFVTIWKPALAAETVHASKRKFVRNLGLVIFRIIDELDEGREPIFRCPMSTFRGWQARIAPS